MSARKAILWNWGLIFNFLYIKEFGLLKMIHCGIFCVILELNNWPWRVFFWVSYTSKNRAKYFPILLANETRRKIQIKKLNEFASNDDFYPLFHGCPFQYTMARKPMAHICLNPKSNFCSYMPGCVPNESKHCTCFWTASLPQINHGNYWLYIYIYENFTCFWSC